MNDDLGRQIVDQLEELTAVFKSYHALMRTWVEHSIQRLATLDAREEQEYQRRLTINDLIQQDLEARIAEQKQKIHSRRKLDDPATVSK